MCITNNSHTNAETDVVLQLIQYYPWLFDVDREKLAVNDAISQVQESLEKGTFQKKNAGDIRTWIRHEIVKEDVAVEVFCFELVFSHTNEYRWQRPNICLINRSVVIVDWAASTSGRRDAKTAVVHCNDDGPIAKSGQWSISYGSCVQRPIEATSAHRRMFATRHVEVG